jgi:hypothetical protein
MPFRTRPDATLVQDGSALRRMMPHLLPTRMDAVLFFELPIPMEAALDWLDRRRAVQPDDPVTVFQLVLGAIVRTLDQRPRMNRFVKGGRVWQRDHVALTFAVKKSLDDDARITSMKVSFEPGDGLETVRRRIAEATARGRSSEETRAERSMRNGAAVPLPLLRLGLWWRRFLDDRGLLPRDALESSPLHTSAMISNVGTLGIDAAFHHLYEDGACSINATVGRIERRAFVRDDGTIDTPRTLTVRFAFDDRVCDGFYAAKTMKQLTELLQAPETYLADAPEAVVPA